MASLPMLDPKGTMVPEDKSAYSTSSHKLTANQGPDKPQLSFSPRGADSPTDNHLPPSTRRADSHQCQVHSHRKEFHATSADDQLSGCHHGSKVNSASQVKLWFQPHQSSNLTSSGVNNTHRFIPYFNPTKNLSTIPKSSQLDCLSDKSSKMRKRTVIIKPKFPKYEGLSNFAAPVDLVSDMIPCKKTNNPEKSISSPSLKSVSSLNTDKISLESNPDSTNTDAHPTGENPQPPVDFLKHLDFEEWDRRKQDLWQMVEDRKKLFLNIGFAETSGKPFQPDEQAIEKKPIPNRWVWYMHLSTDYDKLKNTRVPPGGPAGYLKYGWDRLGPAGKQPYQELTDIYAAERLKFMAAHGIAEEHAKKKTKQIEKPKTQRHSPQELLMRADHKPAGFMNESHSNGKMTSLSINESIERPNAQIDMPFVPLQPVLQCNLLYQQLNPFVHEKLNWNCPNGPADIFEFNEAASYSSYLRSPEMSSDYFSPFYNEAGYGSHLNSEPLQPLGTPIGFTSPNEYAFSCSPSSMIPCPATSEFQSGYTLSPKSVHSTHSDMSGVMSTSSVDNRSSLASPFGNLPPSNPLCGAFNRQEITFHSLNPVDINS